MTYLFAQQAEENLCGIIDAKLAIQSIKIGGFDIHYVTVGNGPPLLLIHGLNIGWGNWYANIAELSKHFTIYALDLPGCGLSTKINFYTSDLEKDFVNIVDQFINELHLKNVSIIGHSFGGWIAMKLVLKNKTDIQKIILVDPIGFSSFISGKQHLISIRPAANFLAKTAMKPTRKNMRAFLISAMANTSNLEEKFVDYYYQSVIREKISHPFYLMNHLLQPFRFRKDLSLLRELSKISNSTLIIAGEKDPIISLKKNLPHYKKIPNVKISIFQKTGHVVPIEKSSQFNQTVIDFLINDQRT